MSDQRHHLLLIDLKAYWSCRDILYLPM